MWTRGVLRRAALGVLALLAGGCAATKPRSAAEFFARASESFSTGAYELAVEQYRELLDEYPFSEHTEEAEFQSARAQELAGNCREAIAAFTDFQRRHPTSAYLPAAGYLVGRCYERQMKPPDRDQSASQSAHASYLAVLQQYPESPFADLAREDLEQCRRSLAAHELLVARFYAALGREKAAEFRLFDLLNGFEETPEAARALAALGRLYEEKHRSGKAALAYAALAYHFPHDEAASAARAALSRLAAAEELPAGDPLVVLKAMVGRARKLNLADVLDMPGLPAERGGAVGPGSIGPQGTPFGGY